MKHNMTFGDTSADIRESSKTSMELEDVSADELSERLTKSYQKLLGDRFGRTEVSRNPCITQHCLNNPLLVVKYQPKTVLDIDTSRLKTSKQKIEDLVKEKAAQIITVDKGVKAKFINSLDFVTSKLKTTLINDLTPLTMGLNIALQETEETIKVILDNADIKRIEIDKLKRLAHEVTIIKTLEILLDMANVGKLTKRRFINSYIRKLTLDPGYKKLDPYSRFLNFVAKGGRPDVITGNKNNNEKKK